MESKLGLSTAQTDWDPVFKGAYEYYQSKNLYSEENFKVFKNRKDAALSFEVELLTRLDNGEFLKIYIVYRVTKEFTPISVVIDKYIGKQHVQEKYSTFMNETSLTYEFTTDEGTAKVQIPIPPRYQIATPATVTKFLFLASKKYDATGRNFYNVMTAENTWSYTTPPAMKYVMMERISTTPEEITIKDKLLRGTHFKIFSNEDHHKTHEDPIDVYISKHFTIPYLIDTGNDIKIQIRYLQEIDNTGLEEVL